MEIYLVAGLILLSITLPRMLTLMRKLHSWLSLGKESKYGLSWEQLGSVTHRYQLALCEDPMTSNEPPGNAHTSGEENMLDLLPNSVVLTILGGLDVYSLMKTGLVCRRLHAAVKHKSLWRRLDMYGGKTMIQMTNERVAQLAEEHRETIHSVSLRGCQYVDNVGLITISKILGRKLTSLDVVHCNYISNRGLKALGENCENLRVLDCSWTQVSNKGIKHILEGCKKLEVLKVNWCSKLTTQTIYNILKSPCALREVSIDGCGGIHPLSIERLEEELPELKVTFKKIQVII